jgi:propanol-preferring alcohol dehydrogenase
MVLEKQEERLSLQEVPQPDAGPGSLLLRVLACGICRTDLHILDGELTEPTLPLIPGHQIVGEIVALGDGVAEFQVGQRVGVPWLGGSCGNCWYCRHQQENLCDNARYTGYQINGGFSEFAVADASYCFPLPGNFEDAQAAPLLCAGLIGYRAYRLLENRQRIGLYGFGAAAHILTQVARHQDREVYAFTRPGDDTGQAFARELGAVWSGDSQAAAPVELDGAIIFAPAGELVPTALASVRKGGRVICAGIHMSDIPAFPYDILWGERELCSVANLTRRDGDEFLPLAAEIPVRTHVQIYALEQTNEALEDLRYGRFNGAAVIVP